MPDNRRPVLLLSNPTKVDRERTPGGGVKYQFPSRARQKQRLQGQIASLEKAMGNRGVFLSGEALGAEPEGVLVLDIVGELKDFHKAAKAVDIEWLGEYDEEPVAPDDDFVALRYNRKTKESEQTDKLVGRHIYLTATNLQSLNKFKSLWDKWKRGAEFPRGQTNWRNLFNHLREVRFWDANDRLRESGILDVWGEMVGSDAEAEPFAVELWFRSDVHKRAEAERAVRKFVKLSDGETIGKATVIPEIAYHSMIVRLPRERIADLVNESDSVALARCDQIMLMRPTGQVASTSAPPTADLLGIANKISAHLEGAEKPDSIEPEVAILDGLPQSDHESLQGRIEIDDPENYEEGYSVKARTHGTNVASVVVHGDLSANGPPLKRLVYLRPIMRYEGFEGDEHRERIPAGVDEVGLVYSAVIRAMKLRPSLKVFLLAIGDPGRVMSGRISPWARLVDFLSHKYNVLFVISAGNHNGSIQLQVGTETFQQLERGDRDKLVLSALYADAIKRGLLAPSDSINCVTVGAANEDASPNDKKPMGTEFPLLTRKGPAPFSAVGYGYKRSVKPDLLTDGGRLPYRLGVRSSEETRLDVPNGMSVFPGIATAIPHPTFKYRYESGTTLAAALVARRAAMALEYIRHSEIAPGVAAYIEDDYLPVLAKAMTVHGARWRPESCAVIDEALGVDGDKRATRRAKTRLMGYGYVGPDEPFDCSARRVTCLGYGTLDLEEGHEYLFPLPPVLMGLRKPVWRRMIVTIAYISPIKPTVKTYRKVHVFAKRRVPHNVVFDLEATQDVDSKTSGRGTLQHQVYEGKDVPVFTDGDNLAIVVSSRKDAWESKSADGDIPVRYGLVVTLEVAENIDIHSQVRDRIKPRVRVRGRA